MSICTHGGSRVPTTPITNSKVVHSCTITINIYIDWNAKKLVRGNLISLFSIGKQGEKKHFSSLQTQISCNLFYQSF